MQITLTLTDNQEAAFLAVYRAPKDTDPGAFISEKLIAHLEAVELQKLRMDEAAEQRKELEAKVKAKQEALPKATAKVK